MAVAHHLPRHRIDGGLARRDGQAGQRHGADAGAGFETDAAAARALPHRGEHQRAMGHVGIVARILDHARDRRVLLFALGGKREGHALPAGQRDLDRIGKRAGDKRRERGLGRRRRAGAGGPAALEGPCLVHGRGNSRFRQDCHRARMAP